MFKILFPLMLLFTLSSVGQDLKKYQWKNRVLLVYADDLKSEIYLNQLQEFSDRKEDLKDRKLIIIDSKTNQYRIKNSSFTVTLLGLDGGVKLQQNTLLTAEKLFTIIDGMPMRKREIRRKNK